MNEAEETAEEDYPLTAIRQLATDMGVSDLSMRHSSYAHDQVHDAAEVS